MPLLTLFALEALLDLEALNSNNVRGGTCLAKAGGAKKSGWEGDPASSIRHPAGRGKGQGGRRPPHPWGDDQRLRFREGSLESFSSESCFLRAVAGRSVRDCDRRDSPTPR